MYFYFLGFNTLAVTLHSQFAIRTFDILNAFQIVLQHQMQQQQPMRQ